MTIGRGDLGSVAGREFVSGKHLIISYSGGNNFKCDVIGRNPTVISDQKLNRLSQTYFSRPTKDIVFSLGQEKSVYITYRDATEMTNAFIFSFKVEKF